MTSGKQGTRHPRAAYNALIKPRFILHTENFHVQAIDDGNLSHAVVEPSSPLWFLTDSRAFADSEDAMLAVARNKCKISNNYFQVTSPQAYQSIGAMAEENTTIDAKKVKDAVECPVDVKPIGSRWVFKVEKDSSGKRFKASLVCKGFFSTTRYNFLGKLGTSG